jgi:hypothetical protein
MSARYPFGIHRGSFPSKIEVVTAATRDVYGALSGPLITPLALAPSRRVSPCPHGCSGAELRRWTPSRPSRPTGSGHPWTALGRVHGPTASDISVPPASIAGPREPTSCRWPGGSERRQRRAATPSRLSALAEPSSPIGRLRLVAMMPDSTSSSSISTPCGVVDP